jgi:hypothetical protein
MAASAPWRALLALAVALVAESAAAAVDVPYTPTPQRASLLCWAATTQMVADAMTPPHPVDPDELYKIVAQAFVPVGDPLFDGRVQACKMSIKSCDTTFSPILDKMGFTFLNTNTSAHPAQSLTQDELRTELDHGRLMIFGWEYADSSRGGLHLMLIAGYHLTASGSLRLHIYDPLPVDIGSAQTITYNNYTVATPKDLHNDMGLPYAQSMNYYDIQYQGGSRPLPPSNFLVEGGANSTAPLPPAPAPPVAAHSRESVALGAAIQESRPSALRELAQFDAEDYSPPHGQQAKPSVDKPFPIVALGLDELRAAAGAPTAQLLRAESGVVLYPVLAAGKIRDSFLLIKRGTNWIRGGYANTAVARLLVEQRNRRANSGRPQSASYLVSVPEFGVFFLAQGSGDDATLIPVTSDPSIRAGDRPLQAGQAYKAGDVLAGLIDAAVRFEPRRVAAPELKQQ